MNKNILKISTLVAIWAFCSQNATAQQGFGTNQPSKASVIEMKSGTKGLLIPRVALTGLNDFDPIKGELGTDAAKVNSLLVYNTATATGISPGYYYWTTDGVNGYWQRLLASDDAAALSLLGDVTGTLGATTVVKIQGRDVANAAPTSNQVLTWNGSAWTPTSLTPAQITNKATLSVQDGIAITAGSGTDALLGAAAIGITDGGIAPVKIQPAAEPRTTRMVMVTQTDGTVTWIPQTDIAPTTTNTLSSAVNSMTSNVNGVSSSANIIKTNGLSVAGTELTSTVNGVPATVDLASVVQAGETLTSITQDATSGVITYKRERDADQTANVVSATSDNLISYDAGAFLNATTIQDNQLNTVVAQGTGITVTPGTSGNTTTYTVAAKAVSGVEIHDDNVKLGGNLTRETTITQNGNEFTIATGGSNLNISGLDKTKVQATDATAGITDRLLAVDGNDKVKALKAAMPKFFYMPSVMVPTAESHLGQAGVTFDNSTRTGTINLYTIYVAQFGTPVMSSAGATPLPVLPAAELSFHVTYATSGVFTISSISATGLLTYSVDANANVTNGNFINIVFSVKED